jgi:Rod binding domain-containing protein
MIDAAVMNYQNRPLKTPGHVDPQGMGRDTPQIRGGKTAIDRSSKLYEQCQEFEAIFLKIMLNQMRSTIDKSGLIDGGQAEEIFTDMLYDQYSMSMAKTAGMGLADAVYIELSRGTYI